MPNTTIDAPTTDRTTVDAAAADAPTIETHVPAPLERPGRVVQPFGQLVSRPIALAAAARAESVADLNQLLADTMALRDLYKKHHWQVTGPTFHQLHLLFDAHHGQQVELIDAVAERIQLLGGVSVATAHDVAELTRVPRAPKDREDVPGQIGRLLHAHEVVLAGARTMAQRAAARGDDGSNDLLVGGVIRTNELQVWFLAEHVQAGAPLLG